MTKVVIVDDEYLHREALKQTMPWIDLDCEVIGEAENGEEGLKLIKTLKPDVVIVDINMPLKDGLSMVKELKDQGEGASFIMLTGFAEMAYARQAIKYGVDSFCLKPIDDHEFIAELNRVIKKRNKRDHSNVKLDSAKKKDTDISDYMNALLKKRKIEEKEVVKYLEGLGMAIKSSRVLICLKVASYCDPESKKELMHYFRMLFEENLNWDLSVVSWHEGNALNIMLSSDNENNLTKMKLSSFLNEAASQIKKSYDIETIIAVSIIFSDMKALLDRYRDMSSCFRQAFFQPRTTVLFSKDMTGQSGRLPSNDIDSKMLQVFYAIRYRNMDHLKTAIKNMYDLAAQHDVEIDRMHEIALSIYRIAASYYNDFKDERLPKQHQDEFRNKLLLSIRMDEHKGHTTRTIREIIQMIDPKKVSEKSKLISDIKVYIQEHIGDSELDIESISTNSNFSYHYVCKMFKKKTGKTLGRYILEIRMEQAKKLILEGIESVDQLADEVGYTDTNYFSKSFKKYFEISPSKLIKVTKEI